MVDGGVRVFLHENHSQMKIIKQELFKGDVESVVL